MPVMTLQMTSDGKLLKLATGELMNECCCYSSDPPTGDPPAAGTLLLDLSALEACCDNSAHVGRPPNDNEDGEPSLVSYTEPREDTSGFPTTYALADLVTLTNRQQVFANIYEYYAYAGDVTGYFYTNSTCASAEYKTLSYRVQGWVRLVGYGSPMTWEVWRVWLAYQTRDLSADQTFGWSRRELYDLGWSTAIWPSVASCGGRETIVSTEDYYHLWAYDNTPGSETGYVKVYHT